MAAKKMKVNEKRNVVKISFLGGDVDFPPYVNPYAALLWEPAASLFIFLWESNYLRAIFSSHYLAEFFFFLSFLFFSVDN